MSHFASPPGGKSAVTLIAPVAPQEFRKAEHEVRELREALAARDEFISILSHELRNVVSPLLLHLTYLKESVDVQPDKINAEWLAPRLVGFEDRVKQVMRTLNALLDISRCSSGELALQFESVDLGKVVADVCRSFDRELLAGKCELSLKVASGVVGNWDRMRIEQIARNLLSNAIRYGAGNSIEVEVRGNHQSAELHVRDHGMGIAPEQQEHIFRQFGRANHQPGGFGVGLWLVKKICTALGGQVHLHSQVGSGSTFSVVLPLEPRNT